MPSFLSVLEESYPSRAAHPWGRDDSVPILERVSIAKNPMRKALKLLRSSVLPFSVSALSIP